MGKSPSYFYKILLLFLVTVFVTSLVLTLFSYEQFSKSLQEKAYADYQAGLKKNAQTWMDLSSEIGQLIPQLQWILRRRHIFPCGLLIRRRSIIPI